MNSKSRPILKHHSCGRGDVSAPCDQWTETRKGRRNESKTDPSEVGKHYVLTYQRTENKARRKATCIHASTLHILLGYTHKGHQVVINTAGYVHIGDNILRFKYTCTPSWRGRVVT